jgi:hypothetical protein
MMMMMKKKKKKMMMMMMMKKKSPESRAHQSCLNFCETSTPNYRLNLYIF